MKIITVKKFKNKCLQLIQEVGDQNESLTITKYGKPIAQLAPVTQIIEDRRQKLLGSIIFENDILSPIDADGGVLETKTT